MLLLEKQLVDDLKRASQIEIVLANGKTIKVDVKACREILDKIEQKNKVLVKRKYINTTANDLTVIFGSEIPQLVLSLFLGG